MGLMGIVRGQFPIPAEYGQRVRFHRQPVLHFPELRGEGVFVLAWLGVEEVWEIVMDDDSRVGLHPCFGDSMEPV